MTSNAQFAVLPIFKLLLRSALTVITIIILSLLKVIVCGYYFLTL